MKKTKITLHDGKESFSIEAEEGKILRRKVDGWETTSVYLDYTCFKGEPILFTPEDFEEVDNK